MKIRHFFTTVSFFSSVLSSQFANADNFFFCYVNHRPVKVMINESAYTASIYVRNHLIEVIPCQKDWQCADLSNPPAHTFFSLYEGPEGKTEGLLYFSQTFTTCYLSK